MYSLISNYFYHYNDICAYKSIVLIYIDVKN